MADPTLRRDPSVVVVRTIREVRAAVGEARRVGRRIGCVPTMGALHDGHLALIHRARAESDYLVVTLFVNPTQFATVEDLAAYPRCEPADCEACRQAGVDLVFAPPVDEVCGPEPLTTVHVDRLTDGLCGPHRPGHFDGVTTVVTKLFNIVQPDAAYFGQKDAQQAVVIRRMVEDLNFPIDVVVCETVRDADGVALSSRNAMLEPDQRLQARAIAEALRRAEHRIAEGERDIDALTSLIRDHIRASGPCTVEYVDIVQADTLAPLDRLAGKCLIALAVKIGRVRLIDNTVVDVS